MKAYTVYRYDYFRHSRDPVGMVLERRTKDRGNNIEGLTILAKKLYSTPVLDIHVVLSPE